MHIGEIVKEVHIVPTEDPVLLPGPEPTKPDDVPTSVPEDHGPRGR